MKRWRRVCLAAAVAACPALSHAEGDADGELRPAMVRQLAADGDQGKNDSSPSWAPGGDLIAFERAEESKREIVIARVDGTVVKTVYYQTDDDDMGLGALLPSLGKATSYNSGITWSPTGDRFVFMSNAGEGNYDLYLGTLAGKSLQRLTRDPHKDGQPHWAPRGGSVAFVSGMGGGAQLYLLDVDTQRLVSVSPGDKSYLYPRWSPDGKRIAAIYGANENHDVVVIEDLPSTAPADANKSAGANAAATANAAAGAPAAKSVVKQRQLTTWNYDDLSPSWSPDGKRIAFYSNYNLQNDPKMWSLIVVDADGSSPTEGEGLAAHVVAYNVVPDVSMGPAWLPDSRRIAYVRNDRQDYSPINVVDVETKRSLRLATGTAINHDLASSSNGLLAFRAQVDQWDRIFIVRIDEQHSAARPAPRAAPQQQD